MIKQNDKEEMRETVIEPSHHGLKIDLAELWRYRDLLFFLVRRDFMVKYKQTILGPAWFVLQPLLTTLVFTVIFGKFAKIFTDDIPPILFYLCGLLAWDYFSQCLSGISNVLITNGNLIKKIYFPRLILPLSIIMSLLMRYAVQAVFFIAFYIYYYFFTPASAVIHPNAWIFFLPAAVFLSAFISLGAGLWICACTVKYRDLQNLVAFGIQLWMYVTPVIYPLKTIPSQFHWIIFLNPMAEILEFYRKVFFGTGEVSLSNIGMCFAGSLVLFLSGLFMFNRVEQNFADTL